MNFRLATLIAVPVLAAVSYLTYLQLQPAEDTAQARSAAPVDQSSAALTSERDTGTNGADLAALRGEVASLSAENLALRQQMSTQPAPVRSRVDTLPVPDARSDLSARSEATKEQPAPIKTVEAAFHEQVTDQSWSATATSTIREALNSATGGLQADNIDCRSSSCRVELHDDGTGLLSKSLPILTQQLAVSMPTITAGTLPQDNGTSNVVLYMSRDSDVQPARVNSVPLPNEAESPGDPDVMQSPDK